MNDFLGSSLHSKAIATRTLNNSDVSPSAIVVSCGNAFQLDARFLWQDDNGDYSPLYLSARVSVLDALDSSAAACGLPTYFIDVGASAAGAEVSASAYGSVALSAAAARRTASGAVMEAVLFSGSDSVAVVVTFTSVLLANVVVVIRDGNSSSSPLLGIVTRNVVDLHLPSFASTCGPYLHLSVATSGLPAWGSDWGNVLGRISPGEPLTQASCNKVRRFVVTLVNAHGAWSVFSVLPMPLLRCVSPIA